MIVNPCIVLDSPSERQGKQGLDGEFWGQELLEECDYLSGTCGDEDFAQRVQAEGEQRASGATMFFDRNGVPARWRRRFSPAAPPRRPSARARWRACRG